MEDAHEPDSDLELTAAGRRSAEQPLVALRGIVKEFPGVRANDGVDFELKAGEIHALLGENGAGKTTLMNVLAGLARPDAGTIEILGDASPARSPRAAIDRGIGMVHQHFRLVDRFTVAENVTLGWHTPKTLLRRRPLEREIARLSEVYRMPVQADRPVWHLSVGEQQRVEILKNLYRGARVLILDEPTAVLTPQESLGLFDSLRRMAEEGRGIVFISHKLDEVMAVADRITVLRRGKKVATVDKAQDDAGRAGQNDDRPRSAPGRRSRRRRRGCDCPPTRGGRGGGRPRASRPERRRARGARG